MQRTSILPTSTSHQSTHGTSTMALSKTQQTFMDIVIPALKIGMTSLNDLTSTIVVTDIKYILPSQPIFAEIRRLIDRAQRSIALSERAASNELYKIDTYFEELTFQRGMLEREGKAKAAEQKINEIRLSKLKETLKLATETMEASKQEHQNAVKRVEETKRKKEEAQENEKIGYILLIIPIIGWIIGGLQVDASKKDYDNACYQEEQAVKLMASCESTVKHYTAKIGQVKASSSDVYAKIEELKADIDKLQDEITGIKDQRVVVAEFQEKLRRATHILGGLAKNTDAADLETRIYISMDALLTIAQSVFQLSAKMVFVDFLKDEEMLHLVGKLMKHKETVKALPKGGKDIEDYL
ncbi:uncharacterized protein LOC134464515 [Engraulis encrasicolus]|uniref:uncharacterized protein LOC134464515 n=1 Tax=Engraulis encrasicolus TaxID=184585 RepID=UPI002FD388BE